ncbi:uncharacterized protein LOC128210488 [Mya arenaria]|uniref:uncharacterized protein LOC128210488 n=1 Tax=Mya arenaria TaxID=6604 RepID=UPI0022E3ED1D|nr:uncharacterized protein LOC128210488 [Mya arenaria]
MELTDVVDWPRNAEIKTSFSGKLRNLCPLCSSISHLPDLAKGVLKTAEFNQLPAAVDKIRSMLDELKKTRMKDQALLENSYKDIITEINALRNDINTILDQLQEKTVKQLDSLMKYLEKDVKDDLETCVNTNDQLKTMVNTLQQSTSKHKEINLYIGFRKCQTKLNETKSLVQKIQKKPKEGIRFKSDESVLSFLRNLDSLGNVDNVHSMSKTTDTVHVYKIQSQQRYNVKIKEDQKDCYIVSICELPSGEVVITDEINIRVKLLNQQYKVIDHCDLPATPKGVCHTTGNEFAVAVDKTKVLHEVHFLTVTKGQLQTVRKFTTNHKCHTIAHHHSHMYVGSYDTLYLYTMDGDLKRKIYEEKSSGGTVYRFAFSPDGERIYVANSHEHKLVTLDKVGQVLSTLEDPELQWHTGVCVSPSGHVFVCGAKSHTVLQVDREGRQKLATVVRKADGLYSPRSVWFNEQTSSLIVGNADSDSIVVFKLCVEF